MNEKQPVALPTDRKPTPYQQIKQGLAMAAQVIIAAPLKLPPKVVVGAKYVAFLIGVLDTLERSRPEGEPDGDG